MKSNKLLVLSMAALLSLGVFSCAKKPTSSSSTSSNLPASSSSNSIDEEQEIVDAAADYIWAIYKNYETTPAIANFELLTVVPISGKKAQVTWKLEKLQGTDGVVALGEVTNSMQKVTVTGYFEEKVIEDIKFKLTATITYKTKQATKVINRTTPVLKMASHEDFEKACEKKENVAIQGRVVAKSNSGKYMWIIDDENNGYLAFDSGKKLNGKDTAQIGDTVKVIGKGTVYNNAYEFEATPTIKIVKKADETSQQFTPVDLTEKFGGATNDKDHKTLKSTQSQFVELKNCEFTRKVEDSNGTYYYFTVNGKEYSIYSSAKADYMLSKEEQTELFNKFVPGYKATITGLVSFYNQYQIYPISKDAIKITDTTLSYEKKVDLTVDEIKRTLQTTQGVVSKKVYDLPTKGSGQKDATITWSLVGTPTKLELAGNKLTINASDTEIKEKVKATITCGDATKELELEITITKPHTIANFLNNKDSNNLDYIQGIVVAKNSASGNNSFVLYDGTDYIFSYNRLDVTVGDKVVISGTYGENNKFPQLASTEISEVVSHNNPLPTGEAVTAKSIEDAIEAAADDNELINTYSGELTTIKGYIVKSGGYYGIASDKTNTNYSISLYSGIDLAPYEGQEVTLAGVARGTNKNKNQITIQTVSVNLDLDDAGRVALQKEKLDLSLNETYSVNSNINLKNGDYGTTIAWSLEDGADESVFKIANGNLVVTPSEDEKTATLIATITKGEVSDTKTFTLKAQKEQNNDNNITFKLGNDVTENPVHVDGESETNYKEKVGNVTLNATLVKGYKNANDAKGNGTLKFGTGSTAGSMEFEVPADVKSVKIYVANYKANTSSIKVNDNVIAVTKKSNDGEYQEVIVNTSENKTVKLESGVSGDKRLMVNTIVFCK